VRARAAYYHEPFDVGPAGSLNDGGSVLDPRDVEEGVRALERPVEVIAVCGITEGDLHPPLVEARGVWAIRAKKAAYLVPFGQQ